VAIEKRSDEPGELNALVSGDPPSTDDEVSITTDGTGSIRQRRWSRSSRRSRARTSSRSTCGSGLRRARSSQRFSRTHVARRPRRITDEALELLFERLPLQDVDHEEERNH